MTTTYRPGELDRLIEARGVEDGFLAKEWGGEGGVWGSARRPAHPSS